MDQRQRYIAFLRAINVGGRTVKMDRLRALFESLGLADVETFIASGNVIFTVEAGDTGALERRIERHLEASLGYEVATFLRTPAEIAAVTAHRPFVGSDLDGGALSVAFLKAPPSGEAWEKLLSHRSEIDDFDLRERELYWWCRTRVSQSTFSGARLERTLGMPATVRNITTVRKLAARYPASR